MVGDLLKGKPKENHHDILFVFYGLFNYWLLGRSPTKDTHIAGIMQSTSPPWFTNISSNTRQEGTTLFQMEGRLVSVLNPQMEKLDSVIPGPFAILFPCLAGNPCVRPIYFPSSLGARIARQRFLAAVRSGGRG